MESIKKNIEIEACAFSLESCLNARLGGANRVELCSAMFEGGVTPSAGLIKMAREILNIDLYVMIRPRGGDFLYTDLEFEQMKEEIRFAKEYGADGIVVGILKEDGSVDIPRTKELVQLSAPLPVTFHRAFDMSIDIYQALEEVIETGCYRILTSGGKNTVNDSMEILRTLVQKADGRIHIMAGSGVNVTNVRALAATGVDAVHLSGKKSRDSKMKFRNPNIFMGGAPGIPEYEQYYTASENIREVVKLLQ